MTKVSILSEAERLYALGLGVHWLKPNSKAPTKTGWAKGERDDWEALYTEFGEAHRVGKRLGLGVRLGAASKFPDGTFLANLDIDIKSDEAKHKAEALVFADSMFPGLAARAPTVETGYGLRFFFRAPHAVESRRLGGSPERVKVRMPTAPVSTEQTKARDAGLITQVELDDGWRVRSAWEVEVMGAGRQVVLPPSIHPDTGRPYIWTRPLTAIADIPFITELPKGAAYTKKGAPEGERRQFRAAEIDYTDPRFSPHALRLVFGEGVYDRSAAALSLSIALVKDGFSDDEVLTVLTDRDTFIGEMPYEHRSTNSRWQAADWAREYCLKKAKVEADAALAFRNEVIVRAGGLDAEAAEKQTKALVRDDRPWQSKLVRTGKDGDGPPKATLGNTLLIIKNVVSPAVFRRDLFGQRDFYGAPAPWTGAEVGKALTDDDAVAIKEWLGRRFGFEPNVGVIYEAMTVIALENGFHPIRDELEALPAWDGVPRIDTWLARYFEAKGDPAYLAQVFRKWLVASVMRAYEPGAKFDWMPILEGPQGVGKSIFGAVLFGQRYFADWLPNLGDKDAALGLVGKRCVEFGELARLRRSEIETVKAFVTRQFDVVRPPYGRKSVEYYRGVVFYGTTNREHYLQDDTGNRRFCPVLVGWLDFGALARDRDQLWAEALFIYQLGLEPSLYLDGAAAVEAVKLQASKQVEDDSDVMVELISDWARKEVTKPLDEQFQFGKFRINTLFGPMGPLGGFRLDMRNQKYAAKGLRRLGGEMWKSDGHKVWRLSNFQGPSK